MDKLEEVRTIVRQEGQLLTEESFTAIKELFQRCVRQPEALEQIARLTPEYGQPEFFLNVDAAGAVAWPSLAMVEESRQLALAQPEFAAWFQPARQENWPALLVARWLAHFVGLRHSCVHLLLDHPRWPDYTFVQVRSHRKYDSPGLFDVPVGGHIKGTAPVETAATEELHEELNLHLREDLDHLAVIGHYEHGSVRRHAHFIDVEHRTVYLGQVRAEALDRIRFTDQEVAALCLFAVPELELLFQTSPERIAIGLHGSWPVYRQHKGLDR